MESSLTPDEDLVRRLRRGDMAAFDVLYDRYERRFYGYICCLFGVFEGVDDLF